MDIIKVKESKFGEGVYAERDIKSGEVIGHMAGRQVSLENFESLNREDKEIMIDPLQIDDGEYIDLESPYYFINHSCEPNAGIRAKNELFALRDIKKSEEIFYDYSTTMDEGLECECGQPNCRKRVRDFFTLPKERQKEYIEKGAVPDFIKKKFNSQG